MRACILQYLAIRICTFQVIHSLNLVSCGQVVLFEDFYNWDHNYYCHRYCQFKEVGILTLGHQYYADFDIVEFDYLSPKIVLSRWLKWWS